MKNFIFKSNDSDLQKMFSILENLQKNMLYTTHRVDTCVKILDTITHFMVRINKQLDFEGKFGQNLEDFTKSIPEELD